jgi:hypothetical protein
MRYKKIVISILFLLIITNIIWFTISKFQGPFIGLIFYGIIIFLYWKKGHYKAGVIGGFIGLGIHIYELLFKNLLGLSIFESSLFFINLILPIPLIYFSFKSYH